MPLNRVFSFLSLLAVACGPTSSWADDEQAYARAPREIPFQNDSQWEDSRWQETDLGPFLAGSIDVGKETTLKGIAIRIGDSGQAGVCFDTARLRFSAAWAGDFLQFDSRRFGLIRTPQAGGPVFYTTPKQAGWANDGRFTPRAEEITLPEVEQGYTSPGSSETRLPKDWAHFKGMYACGKRVVLSYSVGTTAVLESPWFIQSADHRGLVRSLEIGPTQQEMQLWAADAGSQVIVIGSESIAIMEQERPVLRIAPHNQSIRLNLLIVAQEVGAESILNLREKAGRCANLSAMIQADSGRFPDVLETVGTTADSGGPYVIDTLTLPFENHWKALLFTAGHDFFSDGSAAICTVHGDVWTVSGIDRGLEQLRWRRFATGLCQPLGLKIVDDRAYVIGRNQITRLQDRNADGEADYYENFNNDQFITPRAHDFVTCLETDPQGNFYYIHAKTGVMQVTPDGAASASLADGFRNPNGLGVGPDGMITAAPQQGTWTPESSLIVVKKGGYYGFGGPRITPQRPTGWDLPMSFIPRALDNSGGGQVWVTSRRWGPLENRMLHLSYGQCRLLLALTEEVDGVFQGGTIQFPTEPVDFDSGIMRGRFSPHDGQLYVSGLRGWQTRSIRDGCFQRVRYTGGRVNLPTGVKTYTNGIKLSFPEPLTAESAEDIDNYFVEQWNYVWSETYGSPEFSVKNPKQQGRDEVPVLSATLMDDAHAVFLEMPDRQPVHQIAINWFLTTPRGEAFRGMFAHTINVQPRETISASRLVRRERTPMISAELEGRLEPGVEFRFQSTHFDQSDLRTSRLIALRQPLATGATPFLPPGPFSLDVEGTLRVPLSGFYEFKLEVDGEAAFSIHDMRLSSSTIDGPQSSDSILLRRGHNPLKLHFESPPEGSAFVQLLWKGHNFDWEPVPTELLFHDSGSPELRAAQQRRLGRELFANHHCSNCHRTDAGEDPMFELTLTAPDLAMIGNRLRPDWLGAWLRSPQTLRPGTSMPALLQDQDFQRDAADLVAFLQNHSASVSSRATHHPGLTPLSPYRVEAGHARQQLDGASMFEQFGCVACHHFGNPNEDDPFDRISLYYVRAKFQPQGLIEFLKAPGAFHLATRMPDFRLNDREAKELAEFLRSQSAGSIPHVARPGDTERGQQLFARLNCDKCHSIGRQIPQQPAPLAWPQPVVERGCLAARVEEQIAAPHFAFDDTQRRALANFVNRDLTSLAEDSVTERSERLVRRLQCNNCHDRDGMRSQRGPAMLEDGSGDFPEVLPALTWAGEKFLPQWTEQLLAGTAGDKPRPWLVARMPAFPQYAAAVAHGLAAEHAVDWSESPKHSFDPELAHIGEQLTLQSGLDCRQCHAIGQLQPRGDEETKLALGINFSMIRQRLRREAYHRFMLDPPRYDISTKMIKLSENGLTTKLKTVFDADAHQQFEAVWHYIQSLQQEP